MSPNNSYMIRAASIRFLEGRQPRLAQVPPTVRNSIMTAVWPSYDVYQSRTERQIPLVVLDRLP